MSFTNKCVTSSTGSGKSLKNSDDGWKVVSRKKKRQPKVHDSESAESKSVVSELSPDADIFKPRSVTKKTSTFPKSTKMYSASRQVIGKLYKEISCKEIGSGNPNIYKCYIKGGDGTLTVKVSYNRGTSVTQASEAISYLEGILDVEFENAKKYAEMKSKANSHSGHESNFSRRNNSSRTITLADFIR